MKKGIALLFEKSNIVVLIFKHLSSCMIKYIFSLLSLDGATVNVVLIYIRKNCTL
jgi:hypothetical protein